MAQHVYARLAGFGWVLLPLAPFRFERVPGRPRSILAEYLGEEGVRRATLDFSRIPPAVELAAGTARLEDVLDLLPGPKLDHWWIETSLFTVRWSEGFALHSAPKPPGFDLVGPDGSMVFVQGPFLRSQLPDLAAMAAPGQTVQRQGESAGWAWVELAYLHEGTAWRQTHRVVDFGRGGVCVVTSQAPERLAAFADAAADEVAGSLGPYVEEP